MLCEIVLLKSIKSKWRYDFFPASLRWTKLKMSTELKLRRDLSPDFGASVSPNLKSVGRTERSVELEFGRVGS